MDPGKQIVAGSRLAVLFLATFAKGCTMQDRLPLGDNKPVGDRVLEGDEVVEVDNSVKIDRGVPREVR